MISIKIILVPLELYTMRSIALIALLLVAFPVAARSEQYTNGSQVMHTRLAPVVAHRIAPPFRGVHVYQGRSRR
jgi:hypothetical protein